VPAAEEPLEAHRDSSGDIEAPLSDEFASSDADASDWGAMTDPASVGFEQEAHEASPSAAPLSDEGPESDPFGFEASSSADPLSDEGPESDPFGFEASPSADPLSDESESDPFGFEASPSADPLSDEGLASDPFAMADRAEPEAAFDGAEGSPDPLLDAPEPSAAQPFDSFGDSSVDGAGELSLGPPLIPMDDDFDESADMADPTTDVTAEVEQETYQLPVRRYGRFLTLGAAILGVVLLLSVTLAPELVLRFARADIDPCYAASAPLVADLEACLPTGRAFELASGVPGFVDRSAEIRRQATKRVAELRFLRATTLDPDSGVRDQAAAELLAMAPSRPGALVDRLTGANDAILKKGMESPGSPLGAYAELAARMLGDVESQNTLASVARSDRISWRDFRHGSLHCLVGDRGRGLLKLRWVADGEPSRALGLAILAARACTGDELGYAHQRHLPDGLMVSDAALAMAQERKGARERVRKLLEDPGALTAMERLRLAGAWIGRESSDAVTSRRILAGAALEVEANDEPLTAWSLAAEGANPRGLVVDLEATERAAEHVGKLARAGERPDRDPKEDDDEPSACGSGCADDLRNMARALWIQAAEERARRGEDAREAMKRAVDLETPELRWRLGPHLLAVGDARSALGVIDDRRARWGDAERVRLVATKAYALVSLGRIDDAHVLLGRELSRGQDVIIPLQLGTSRDLDAEEIVLAWMWAATSLEVGAAGETTHRLRTMQLPGMADVARHLEMATETESDRRKARLDMVLPPIPVAALPAAMHLFARWLPADADAEVWLDRLFASEHRQRPLRAMAARAEAARWRGDLAVQKRWLERLRAVQQHVETYEEAVLAALGGLR
jgi:hypothetical protein